jgi:copper chaperone CopZ
MEKLTLEVPAMYGDHHVLEVRRILLEMPGIEDVYASSSFQIVEVSYDPAKLSPEEITRALDQAGYLGELALPEESGVAVQAGVGNGDASRFRHTAIYENTRQAVSFGQSTAYSGRPLWPCPGLGVIRKTDEEN